MSKLFLYAEYQVSIPFTQIDWVPINVEMKKFSGLQSKTWLSGINTNTVGGFYEFDSIENAQKYIDGLLIPFAQSARVGTERHYRHHKSCAKVRAGTERKS